ncbi:MogA/MoaB family molybdenum cofactor biosynthesis protein [Alicyclobacillus acidiphilus]|uniref:MogA/MoaB family molybdenum cofactor biosynthesis protein n=1 Tax=Alicyclobacillus acidiphilus TaxID=182455 RepID=UPI00082EC25A|nr:MogA/MoaB family molybdenum cofactor biosynthesis protein [Alicyclobacillus acidiphilus]
MERFRAVVITASDSAANGTKRDISGQVLRDGLTLAGIDVVEAAICADDRLELAKMLRAYGDRGDVHLIATTGGTGLGPRDVTPEATLDVIDREIPGIPEAMRMQTLAKTPFAMIARQVAGTYGNTLIINFPGSPKAVIECLDVVKPVLEHTLRVLNGNTEHEGQR